MLKKRVSSAIVMALTFLLFLFILPPIAFISLFTAVTVVAAWEWANLAGLNSVGQKTLAVLLLALAMSGLALLLGLELDLQLHQPELLQALFVAAIVWWGVALLWVQGYPSSTILWRSTPVRLLMGLMVLLPTWVGLLYIRSLEYGSWLVLLLVAVVASSDIGAYFVGKRFGSKRLAPSVSPGKTWEGFWGGLVASLLLSMLVGWLWLPTDLLWVVLLVVPAALISVLGDLLESMVKRHRGVKDSGSVLPGHGGILDRVDGLTAAVPVFALTLLVTGVRF